MKSRGVWIGVGVLLLAVFAVVLWPADERLPKPAREAIRKRFPNAQVIEAKARAEGGKTVYSVALRQDGKRADVRLAGDGQVSRVVREVALSDLPRAAAGALAAKYPNATYRSIEEVSRVEAGAETVILYEALLATAAKREVEVQVTPDGKIKSR
jgi:hypothetical protein